MIVIWTWIILSAFGATSPGTLGYPNDLPESPFMQLLLQFIIVGGLMLSSMSENLIHWYCKWQSLVRNKWCFQVIPGQNFEMPKVWLQRAQWSQWCCWLQWCNLMRQGLQSVRQVPEFLRIDQAQSNSSWVHHLCFSDAFGHQTAGHRSCSCAWVRKIIAVAAASGAMVAAPSMVAASSVVGAGATSHLRQIV